MAGIKTTARVSECGRGARGAAIALFHSRVWVFVQHAARPILSFCVAADGLPLSLRPVSSTADLLTPQRPLAHKQLSFLNHRVPRFSVHGTRAGLLKEPTGYEQEESYG